jgi:methanol--5-hydroxybenzimidazolylcobamide Co-methyltransferase
MDGFRYGVAPRPVATRSGMSIGGGTVYPELNFTLPTMSISEETMPEVRRHYREIVASAAARVAELGAPGLVVEFETLPEMVDRPAWGVELAGLLLDGLREARDLHGLRSVLRMTPNDLREMKRPSLMRSGELFDKMIECFEGSAAAGAELLSIESVGGKEIHDDALMMCDLPAAIFALTILGARDMEFLWTRIAAIARRHGVHAAGDTACGFANTAMVMAEKKYIPRVFAAVDRAVSAVRSLVAYECGAVGPGKDCGYENVYLKAITGCPMAMEGKTAACAHLSPVGNVAAALCDTWSNESVQNVRLLAAMAPTCYAEQLVYDCRLMNVAAAEGEDSARRLRDWLTASDTPHDPQAVVLSPEAALRVARAIVAAPSRYEAGRAAALAALDCIEEAHASGALRLDGRETPWIESLRAAVEELPDEPRFIARMMEHVDTARFRPAEYEL